MLRTLLAIAAVLVLATACPKPEGAIVADTPVAAPPAAKPAAAQPAPEQSAPELIARGQELFTGTQQSKTGLACAACHSLSPMMDEGKIYIARDAYTMTRRGVWRATSAEQASAGAGEAATLKDAVALCVSAPYYHNTAGLPAEDLAALEAFIKTLDKPELAAAPVISQAHYAMPAAGLAPDRAHGKEIYATSCKFCHDNAVRGIESLAGATDWLTPIQVMAKVRKVEGDWYNDYKSQTYACADPLARQLALLGISAAYAQEAGAAPPEVNPHTGQPVAAEEEQIPADELFPQNAMPGYAPEILSDQDVVDVAFYVVEELRLCW